MRNIAVLAIGVLMLLIQGNVFRFIGTLGPYAVTPSMVLPLVIFQGVHEHSMARGALLSFALGYLTDILGSAPIGMFAFTYVAIWLLARVSAVRLSAQTIPTRMFLALLFAFLESGVVLMLLAIFGSDPQRPVGIFSMVLPHALTTALVSPPVFHIAQRLHQGQSNVARGGDGNGIA
ncbi:MAG: hypothetical protein RJA70_545 [Pseudomonadota bacterium]|jgi:rod shape-determining protein MreD